MKEVPQKLKDRMQEISKDFQNIEGCWEWPRSRNVKSGYGQINIRISGKLTVFTAHRVSFATFNGDLVEGMLICHKCDNRGCFNPKHLYQGTASDNSRDMYERSDVDRKQNAPRGDKHWTKTNPENIQVGIKHHASKLTEDMVREIRKSTLSSYKLARLFGVSDGTISAVRLGKTWKHVI